MSLVIDPAHHQAGANPSAEEQEEALDHPASEQVNNVVHSFSLQQTGFDKKNYLVHLKVMC